MSLTSVHSVQSADDGRYYVSYLQGRTLLFATLHEAVFVGMPLSVNGKGDIVEINGRAVRKGRYRG